MKISMPIGFILFLVSVINMPCLAQDLGLVAEREYTFFGRFDKQIQHFEAEDKINPPPRGAIVCIGSSSMLGWHESIKDDLAPLSVIPRGFGGSDMNDVLHYAKRIVLPYKPRAIVLYEGDNDIAKGISAKKIADTFKKFVDTIHQELPECRIYFLSIKPSFRRWILWSKMSEANTLISALCTKDKRLTFVDVASAMLDEEGIRPKSIFQKDNLHMNRDGYVIWRDILRPILIKTELQFEKQNHPNLKK